MRQTDATEEATIRFFLLAFIFCGLTSRRTGAKPAAGFAYV